MSYEHAVKQQYKQHFKTLHGEEVYKEVHDNHHAKIVTSMIYVIGDVLKTTIGISKARNPDRRDVIAANIFCGLLSSGKVKMGSEEDYKAVIEATDLLIAKLDEIDVPVTLKQEDGRAY